ncbi:MAG: hypothetical protein M3280_13085 [Actinomycetota bacterium]|jgi:hypothetical protein|nr:hypothetical protein [Actinomycetota bacterium]
MIRAGETIENPVTGERVTFLKTSAETDGEMVLTETTVAPGGFVAAEHIHPHQSERFEILQFDPGDRRERRLNGPPVPGVKRRVRQTEARYHALPRRTRTAAWETGLEARDREGRVGR